MSLDFENEGFQTLKTIAAESQQQLLWTLLTPELIGAFLTRHLQHCTARAPIFTLGSQWEIVGPVLADDDAGTCSLTLPPNQLKEHFQSFRTHEY